MAALVVAFYFLFFPVPIVIVTFVLYLAMLKISGKRMIMPFSWLDIVAPIISVAIWCLIDMYLLADHKRMGNMFEIVGLGGLFSLLFVLRLCVMYKHVELKQWIVIATSIVMVVCAGMMAFLVSPTIE